MCIACSTVSMLCTVLGTHCIVITVRESHNWPVTASHQSVCSRCSKAERVCDNDVEEARIHDTDVWRWYKRCRCFEARSRWSVNHALPPWSVNVILYDVMSLTQPPWVQVKRSSQKWTSPIQERFVVWTKLNWSRNAHYTTTTLHIDRLLTALEQPSWGPRIWPLGTLAT